MCWYNSARNVSTLLKVYSYDTLLYLVRRFKASSTRRNVTQNFIFNQLPRAAVPNPMHHKFVLYGGRIAAIRYLHLYTRYDIRGDTCWCFVFCLFFCAITVESLPGSALKYDWSRGRKNWVSKCRISYQVRIYFTTTDNLSTLFLFMATVCLATGPSQPSYLQQRVVVPLGWRILLFYGCLLYTSDAADE